MAGRRFGFTKWGYRLCPVGVSNLQYASAQEPDIHESVNNCDVRPCSHYTTDPHFGQCYILNGDNYRLGPVGVRLALIVHIQPSSLRERVSINSKHSTLKSIRQTPD